MPYFKSSSNTFGDGQFRLVQQNNDTQLTVVMVNLGLFTVSVLLNAMANLESFAGWYPFFCAVACNGQFRLIHCVV